MAIGTRLDSWQLHCFCRAALWTAKTPPIRNQILSCPLVECNPVNTEKVDLCRPLCSTPTCRRPLSAGRMSSSVCTRDTTIS